MNSFVRYKVWLDLYKHINTDLCRVEFVNFSLGKDKISFYKMLPGAGHVNSKET